VLVLKKSEAERKARNEKSQLELFDPSSDLLVYLQRRHRNADYREEPLPTVGPVEWILVKRRAEAISAITNL